MAGRPRVRHHVRGNLATTQLTISRLQRDADDPNAARSLRTFSHLYEVAEYVGDTLVASQVKMNDEAQQSGVNVQSTLILGGQIAGERPGLYMVYPLGNCIATSPETPYLQIGESKYGKPILDRIIAARRRWKTRHAARWCRWIPPSAPTCRWACRWTWRCCATAT